MNGDIQGRSALVLYGTETGTAQDLAAELGRLTERLRFSTTVAELDAVSIHSLVAYTVTIFVISTTGQGEFPSNARAFWTSLLRKKLSASLLLGVPFFLVGLGDTSYPRFNWAARKLGKRLKQLGALEVIEPCEADEQGEDSTDGAFLAWLPQFRAVLLERFPLPTGIQPLSNELVLPSKWLLEQIAELSNGNLNDTEIPEMGILDEQARRRNSAEFSFDGVDHDARPIPNSFRVILEENRRVTPSPHWQDVRLLTLTTNQQIDYFPGDAISILPKNFPNDVDVLIQLMNWTNIADTSITFVPNLITSANSGNYPPSPIASISSPPCAGPLTLRHLLTSYLDITSIPRRSLFTLLSRYAEDPTHRERLLEFTEPQYLDEYYDYATRPRRSILEILQEFDSVKIPSQEAANVFPVMRGRLFSIASGGALKKRLPPENPDAGEKGHRGGTRFELLVAIVKYKTVIKKTRQGVCTRYLAALAPGSTLNVVHRTDGRFAWKRPGGMGRTGKHDTSTKSLSSVPKLLIGAGTGIAPLRALITEDEENARNQPPQTAITDAPSTVLFFGSRNRGEDFFFANEWTSKQLPPSSRTPSFNLENKGRNQDQPNPAPEPETESESDFKLITAFSRDQPQKIYLQDRIRQHAGLVYDMVVNKNATVIVCGSSGAMPKAVRCALVDCLVDHHHHNEQQQQQHLKQKQTTRRGSLDGERDGGGVEPVEADDAKWTRDFADSYLDQMEKERRYLQETW